MKTGCVQTPPLRGKETVVGERLKGKIALVMGAGSIGPGWGNGKAAAVAFAREGAKVMCVDINPDAARETAGIIADEGGEAEARAADATQSGQVADVVAACLDRWGRIDVLHNNIGVAHMGDVVEIDEARWDMAMNVNLKSAMLAMKHVLPVMVRQGGGSIVNISSVTAIRHVGVEYASYYATKAALLHLTRTTAVKYARDNIRMNAILPGMMKTPLVEQTDGLAAAFGLESEPTPEEREAMWARRDARIPMGHMGDAWDVANAAVFLASDEARYITGAELVVDGGMSLATR